MNENDFGHLAQREWIFAIGNERRMVFLEKLRTLESRK